MPDKYFNCLPFATRITQRNKTIHSNTNYRTAQFQYTHSSIPQYSNMKILLANWHFSTQTHKASARTQRQSTRKKPQFDRSGTKYILFVLLNTAVWRIYIYLQIKANCSAVYTIFVHFVVFRVAVGFCFCAFPMKIIRVKVNKRVKFWIFPWIHRIDWIEGVVVLKEFAPISVKVRNKRESNNKNTVFMTQVKVYFILNLIFALNVIE